MVSVEVPFTGPAPIGLIAEPKASVEPDTLHADDTVVCEVSVLVAVPPRATPIRPTSAAVIRSSGRLLRIRVPSVHHGAAPFGQPRPMGPGLRKDEKSARGNRVAGIDRQADMTVQPHLVAAQVE